MPSIGNVGRLEVAARTLLDAHAPEPAIAAARRAFGDVSTTLLDAAEHGPGPYTSQQVSNLAWGGKQLADVAAGADFANDSNRNPTIAAWAGALLLDTHATSQAADGHVLLDVGAIDAALPRVDATTGERPADVMRLAAAGRLLEGVVPTDTRSVESGMGIYSGAVQYTVDGFAQLQRDIAALPAAGGTTSGPALRDIGVAAVTADGAVSEAKQASGFARVVASVRDLGEHVAPANLSQAISDRLVELQPSVRNDSGSASQLVDAVWDASTRGRSIDSAAARARFASAGAEADPVASLLDRAWGNAPSEMLRTNYRTTALTASLASGTATDVAKGVDLIVGSFSGSTGGRLDAVRAALAVGAPATAAGTTVAERLRLGATAVEHALDLYDGPHHRVAGADDLVRQLSGLTRALDEVPADLRETLTPNALDATLGELARASESLVARGSDDELVKWNLWPERSRISKSLVDARLLADMLESSAAAAPATI